MPEDPRGLTRRGFLASAMAAGAMVPASATAAPQSPRATLPIDVLGLDAATRADVEAFAEPVLRETRWLDELPLDTVPFAFRFEPDSDRGGGER